MSIAKVKMFILGVLQSEDNEDEWQQDCLVLLLKLVGHLGIAPNNSESHSNSRSCEILSIPRLHEVFIS